MITIAAGAIELSLVCARRRIHYHAADVNLGATRSGHMIGFLLRAAIAALGLWLAAEWLPGLSFDSTQKLVIAALLLGIVNAIVRPIVVLLTLPVTLITLGLFLLVVNAAMLGLVAAFLPGFSIAGFWPALWAALLISLVSWLGSALFKKD
jgi:putative membrane protein